jgi:hypothetical protein
MTGYTNGSGRRPDDDPPKRTTNITSLDEVRKRAEAEAKAQLKAERRAKLGPNPWRDRAIGALFIVMAVGMIWHWLAPLFRAGAR